ISIPMPVLFEAPTLAVLAQRVSAQENVQDESFAVLLPTDLDSLFQVVLPLRSHGDRPPLFCIHPAGELGWCYA
ncbi:hypothetical protein KQH58_17075, partial [Mycetohabitans sp. B6]|nr:hypothetical protein [Mycetohabitans sp. B6]